MKPSETRQPAMVPTFGMRKVSLHLGAALVGFLDRRLEQAGHGLLDLVLQFVNDRVQADIDFFLVGEFLRFAFRTHVEADDDRVRGRGQQHVASR